MKRQKEWEPLMFRPELPADWKCMEQRGIIRVAETTFSRWGKAHHNGEPRRFWIVFNEFDPNHWMNETNNYRYSVRGGNDVKPGTTLKFFANLKDAENYIRFLAESTDKWLAEINSEKHIKEYNRRIEEIKKSLDKRKQPKSYEF